MKNTFADFQDRCIEIDNYLKIVYSAEQGELRILDKSHPSGHQQLTTQQITTLKASCFLMIYNLVESTIKNAIQELYDHMHHQKIPFDSLNESMKIQILKNISLRSATDLVKKLNSISLDSILMPFEKDEIFSGNVDARSIREKLKTYGIKQKKSKCDELLTVKNKRNSLAHGNITFSHCGKDYTSKQLADMFNIISKYMKGVLDDVEDHINQKKYQ
ncbi:MAG: hypothetical protein LWW79_07635 [Holophagaceae bacterium]|nr:hypothetical protein [Holophagaceae bacterium]